MRAATQNRGVPETPLFVVWLTSVYNVIIAGMLPVGYGHPFNQPWCSAKRTRSTVPAGSRASIKMAAAT